MFPKFTYNLFIISVLNKNDSENVFQKENFIPKPLP